MPGFFFLAKHRCCTISGKHPVLFIDHLKARRDILNRIVFFYNTQHAVCSRSAGFVSALANITDAAQVWRRTNIINAK